MKNLKIIKFIIPILTIICIICMPITVKAGNSFFGDIVSGADDFIQEGQNGTTVTPSNDDIKSVSDDIYFILLTIGIVAAVIVGGILGIQFMLAGAEDKAKIKEALIPYVIGCIVVFGAFTIWKIVVEVLS